MSMINNRPVPIPLDEDIDEEFTIDAAAFDKEVIGCLNIAVSSLESKGLNIEDYNSRYPLCLSSIIQGLKENHTVIRDIFKKYSAESKPEMFAAMPIARMQVECIFSIVLLLRKPNEMFINFEKSSWLKQFKRFNFEREVEEWSHIRSPRYPRKSPILSEISMHDTRKHPHL